MRRLEIHIERANWNVVLLYHVSCVNTPEVMQVLRYYGCEGADAEASVQNVGSCRPNNGITYSNYARGVSVMIIGVTTTAGEFVNTFVHECVHLANHIGEATGMGISSEAIAYTVGEFGRDVFCKVFGAS